MSYGGLLGLAAYEEARMRVERLQAEASSSGEFDNQFGEVSNDIAQTDLELSTDRAQQIVSQGMSSAEVDALYSEVRQEADLLFERYSKAVLSLRAQGIDSPTRLQLLQHISQNQTQIRIVHLNSSHVNALLDFYLNYSDVEEDGEGDQISTDRYTQTEQEAAEEVYINILLEAMITSMMLKNKGRQESKRKKDKKKETKELEREHNKFIAQMAASQRKRSKAKKK